VIRPKPQRQASATATTLNSRVAFRQMLAASRFMQ
jgi:hypothetical protein